MPHVVFDRKIDLERFSKEFLPINQRDNILIKIEDVFLNREKNTALLPTLVIDDTHQQFMIEITTREQKSTLRLYPSTDPQKTQGVKNAMGLVAHLIISIFANLHITKTNIEEFIPKRIIDIQK